MRVSNSNCQFFQFLGKQIRIDLSDLST